MTIERLAEAPLILYDARWAAQDPTRARLRERAQRAGVRLEPLIEVEYMTAALDLAARGLGDTVSLASLLTARQPAARHGRLRPADRRELAFITRRSARLSPCRTRVHGAGRATAQALAQIDPHGGRHCCRRGVPADDLLAAGGGPADDRANVARAMQLSAPTVHEMVGRLERDGYITRAADKSISFTPEGREQAEAIVRRHRLIERFLTDVLKIPWDDVHEEAERLEHAMSPVLEARMLAAIGEAKTCPHGHPIGPATRIEGVPLGDTEIGAKVKILRFENEAEDLLHLFKREGLEPGRDGAVSRSTTSTSRSTSTAQTGTLTRSVAETVSVLADPSPPPRIALPEQLVIGTERYGR